MAEEGEGAKEREDKELKKQSSAWYKRAKLQQEWEERLAKTPIRALRASEGFHVHLNFQGGDVMRRLFLLSFFLARSCITGHFVFVTWNSNDTCPGFLGQLLEVAPKARPLPMDEGVLTHRWRLFDIGPALVPEVKERSSGESANANATASTPTPTPRTCGKCFGGKGGAHGRIIHFRHLPKIAPMRIVHLGVFEESKENQVLRDLGLGREGTPLFKARSLLLQFLFRSMRPSPDLLAQTLRFASEHLSPNGENAIGVYVDGRYWGQKQYVIEVTSCLEDYLKQGKQRKQEKQVKETQVLLCTNSARVRQELSRTFLRYSTHLLHCPGELEIESSKRALSAETRLMHAYLLAACSSVNFLTRGKSPEWDSVDCFEEATIAMHHLVKEERRQSSANCIFPFPLVETDE